MPTSQTPIDPETPLLPDPAEQLAETTPDPDAPVSFVPHPTPGEPPRAPIKIRTNRFGEMEEHELVRLLDTIEDERARGRFRESIYISFFVWLAIAWFVFYGPRFLWHAPRLINPADVLKQRELTELNMPNLPRNLPAPHPAPQPAMNKRDLEAIRNLPHEAPPPLPSTSPAPAAAPAPVATTPPPTPLPSAPTPQPHLPSAPLPAAPAPQPTARPGSGSSVPDFSHPGVGHGVSGGPSFTPSPRAPLGGGVEVLSDTQGVDFDPYLRRLLADIYRNWLPLIPEEARPPLSKQGEDYIRFTILPDGNIGAMYPDGSTHDVAIDHSCWSAITSEGQFPPLPSQFHGPNLELRIHFLVNKNVEQ